MSQIPSYSAPALDKHAFTCPHCSAYTTVAWGQSHVHQTPQKPSEQPTSWGPTRPIANSWTAHCTHCKEPIIWIGDKIVFPQTITAPRPNPDLSEDIKRDFEEARQIVGKSPRGAAALLRLCVQKLCKELGEDGKNINNDIGNLVKKGLDERVQMALDVVRVVGNNAVHPGQIDLKDDAGTATRLFGLVNLIAEIMISQPKHVKQMFDSLPAEAKTAITKRDAP